MITSKQITSPKGFSLQLSIRPAIHTALAIIACGLLLAACAGGTDSSTTTSSSSGTGCSPGYCNSNGHCCPSNYRYYCEGSCYASSSDAMTASSGRCTSFKISC